jgi:RNA polymerase sigma factor (sigma-70 family)
MTAASHEAGGSAARLDLTVAEFRALSDADRTSAATAMVAMATEVKARMVRARVLQPADAEDVVQELALRVLEERLVGLDRVRAAQLPMSHWIAGWFHQRRRSLWRERRRGLQVESVEEATGGRAAETATPRIDLESPRDQVRELVDNLSPRERSVVEARVANESVVSIAMRLGITERTVQRCWKRAVQHLRARRSSEAWRPHISVGRLSAEHLARLSPRQHDVYRLARTGLARGQIAQRLSLSASTVSNDLARIRALARSGDKPIGL